MIVLYFVGLLIAVLFKASIVDVAIVLGLSIIINQFDNIVSELRKGNEKNVRTN